MDETQPKLERGPETHIYHYPPPVHCTDCGGAGRPGLMGYYRRKESFDDQGRLSCLEHWFEPVEEGSLPATDQRTDTDGDRKE